MTIELNNELLAKNAPEIDAALARCDGDLCYAGDPEALHTLLYVDESDTRFLFGMIDMSARKAALEGVSDVDDGKIQVRSQQRDTDKKIGDITMNTEVGRMARRIAGCAFACGQASETCPLVNPPEQTQD